MVFPVGQRPFPKGHETNVRHGHARDAARASEYGTWSAMKQRCENPRDASFSDYGGRGIKVCDRWASYDAFITDMGRRRAGMTLERVDVNGDYEPSNCIWADRTRQNVNKRLSARNKTGIRGVSWNRERSKWTVHIKRYGRYVLTVRVGDFFEACCLVKSFEAKEAPSGSQHPGPDSTRGRSRHE